MAGLIALAVALFAVAGLDIASPATTASCNAAERSQERELTGQAKREYATVLSKEPTSSCAKKGMEAVGKELCARGKQLVDEKAATEASEVYTEALHLEPLDDATRKCAAAGLKGIEPPAPEPGCSKAAKAPCVVVHVSAQNGRNGFNGHNGTSGKTVVEKIYYGDCHETGHDCRPVKPSPCGPEGCS